MKCCPMIYGNQLSEKLKNNIVPTSMGSIWSAYPNANYFKIYLKYYCVLLILIIDMLWLFH